MIKYLVSDYKFWYTSMIPIGLLCLVAPVFIPFYLFGVVIIMEKETKLIIGGIVNVSTSDEPMYMYKIKSNDLPYLRGERSLHIWNRKVYDDSKLKVEKCYHD